MKLIDPHHPFFRPKWRRVATVTVILTWAAVEFLHGIDMFGWLLLALGIYAIRVLFVPPKTPTEAEKGDAAGNDAASASTSRRHTDPAGSDPPQN